MRPMNSVPRSVLDISRAFEVTSPRPPAPGVFTMAWPEVRVELKRFEPIFLRPQGLGKSARHSCPSEAVCPFVKKPEMLPSFSMARLRSTPEGYPSLVRDFTVELEG